ncbi:MAG TPA: STM3941 family protein [Pyrinomonadaceae bacterium]|nr:STM3941 family protein [Pyrinomonadaceae bacterium]
MEDVVIFSSKRYLAAMAGGCLLFAVGCIYPLVYGFDISDRDALGRFFQLITPEIFYLGAPLAILGFIYSSYRLLKPTPAIIINREGIVDNASALGAGLIRWEEIQSMFIYDVMGNRLLGIIPVNLEAILARQSGLKRFFFNLGKSMQAAPFSIPEGGLPMKLEDLLARIQGYREGLSPDSA